MTHVHAPISPSPARSGVWAINRPARMLVRAAIAIAVWHRHREERRMLDAMPFELRKDLGWPAGDMRETH